MRARGAHEKALGEFRAGKARILLGTQMIAKGLDFPNVTLVGVIQADTALHLPDFRAAERTFQLVTQVAGRTGRGDKGGRVLVQTFSPDHAAIRAAVRHDYAAFAAQELPLRKMLHYPPFRGDDPPGDSRRSRRPRRGNLPSGWPGRVGGVGGPAGRRRGTWGRPRAHSANPRKVPFSNADFKAPTATSCGPPCARPKPHCRRPMAWSGLRRGPGEHVVI